MQASTDFALLKPGRYSLGSAHNDGKRLREKDLITVSGCNVLSPLPIQIKTPSPNSRGPSSFPVLKCERFQVHKGAKHLEKEMSRD